MCFSKRYQISATSFINALVAELDSKLGGDVEPNIIRGHYKFSGRSNEWASEYLGKIRTRARRRKYAIAPRKSRHFGHFPNRSARA
jgi:hypothetical protein